MIKAIIFDCFGVLITDSFGGILNDVNTKAPEKVAHIIQLIDKVNKGEIEPAIHRTVIAEILGISLDEYMERLRAGEVKNQQLLKYIKELKKHYKIGLLSNVGRKGLETRFEEGELAKYFDAVVVSGDIGYAKPEAQAYEITADKLNVRLDECVMIDDKEDYCDGARGVGMQAVQYKSFEQLKKELDKLIDR